ncbi:MAG: GNAT family N-acetyltransferase [Dehalococcoidia bacterium]
MAAYALRPANPEAFEVLYALHRASMERYVTETWGNWDEPFQRRHFADFWPAGCQAIVVAGETAGFLDLLDREGVVWVGNIELAPRWQGRGIGSSILREIQRDAAARGRTVGLQVLKVNPARGLYLRLGFRDNGESATHHQMSWEGAMLATAAERQIVAFLDGEDSPTISNPIHSTEVAAQYGFRGALVGGVTVYGWFTPPLIEVLGERWLRDGWADVRFRRPTFPGDLMTARVELGGAGAATVAMLNPEGVATIEGSAGTGKAPWFDELTAPAGRAAEPKPAEVLSLTLESAPTGQLLRPMLVRWSTEEASAYAEHLQKDTSGRFNGARALAHPGWIAARMTPMLKHSYGYGPAIHIRTQVQHLAPAPAGQAFTMEGKFLRAYEQNGHHVAELDGSLMSEAGEELARLRHTTIFRIRPPRE